MYIRSVDLDGFGEQGIDQSNDGRIIIRFHQVFGFEVVCQCVEVEFVTHAFHHGHGLVAALFVGLCQQCGKLFVACRAEVEFSAGDAPDFWKYQRAEVFTVQYLDLLLFDLPDQHAVTLGESVGQTLL